MNAGKKNRVEDLPGSLAESLRKIVEGDVSALNFLLLPSACIPCCIPFLCLYSLLQRLSAFTVENGRRLKEEEDEQHLQNDAVWR